MPVVSNTSPVLNLAIIDRLDLLRNQFDEIWIPQTVLDELKIESNFPGVNQVKNAIKEGWIKVFQLENHLIAQVLERELDNGEAEAIALAIEKEIVTILIDEHEGRVAAKNMGLVPVGVLGILLLEKMEGRLPSMTDAMEALKEKGGFYIAESLYNQILTIAEEL